MTAHIISFAVTGTYASFRDPSSTSNQIVYYVPSKTAIVGLAGAIIGVNRDNTLGEIYQEEYQNFFSKVSVGIRLENNPRKIVYHTNHRSLKKSNTKPVKKEILESPKYTFFIHAEDSILKKISDAVKNNRYVYPPYLGHAYCPAQIQDLQEHEASLVQSIDGTKTNCVILDESDPDINENFQIELESDDDSSIIMERHLHHYWEDGSMKSRIMKYWIPVNATLCDICQLQNNKFSKFYKIGEKVYCLS